MDVIGPGISWAQMRVSYNKVYQLSRSPGRSPCNEETGEIICQEILDLVKEHLWHRWDSGQLEEESRQSPTGTRTPRMPAQAEFHARMQATYNHYRNMQWDLCEDALAVAWDANNQVLVAVAMLEDHIERPSCSVTHGQPSNQGQLGSHLHLHSQGCSRSHRRCLSAGQQEWVLSVVGHTGDSAKRQAPSSSPTRPRRHYTFEESSPEMKEFLSASEAMQSAEANNSPPLSWAPEATRADP